MSLSRTPGPVDHEADCEYPCCDEDAVACVPDPGTIAGKRFCDFHLALWADCDRGDWDILDQLDVRHLAADDSFLKLDDAPPELERKVRYERIGVDHRGLAHYIVPGRRDDEAETIIVVDADLELVDSGTIPAHATLEDWVDHIKTDRRWVEVDDRFHPRRGDD
ncbi:uncharacterized protein NP_7058A (plasmid) [Natronomonas pharaonis DSM 2160]|uniref:Uncharacterized protein n=1 Tax=Natronomonas pharaonis (strain ATCC 35678 / DSM 2160 / CIP 103997 / JCM 8858 / NBRC 14720 / NCIMB 2260 / Gabara) TaxID=348780 RepID=Q3ILS5_NATPD|nr:hypothetical protein [Natronomonas pharaonis]CAI49758.1 uncharacterized protein NP_3334A [Natronomonas pharaonis DSM 2160]CAI50945.1 uncharacterized protein NP_7058A [Natronomonas pharaonis DSM 2160]